MKETKVTQSNTQILVDRLKNYIINNNLESSISLDEDMLIITFIYPSKPTQNHIQKIKNMVFWTDEIDVPYIDTLINFCAETNTLSINIKNYDVLSGLYYKMKEMRANIKSFDISENDICFCYTISGGRSPFNCDELDQFQNIINPAIKNHDSIRIVGYDRVYTFRVDLNKSVS